MAGDSNVIGHFPEQESLALIGPFQNVNFWILGFLFYFLEWFLFLSCLLFA